MSSPFDPVPERSVPAPAKGVEGSTVAGTDDLLVVVGANVATGRTVIALHGADAPRAPLRITSSDDIQLTADGRFAILDASDDADSCLRGYDLTSGQPMPHMRALRGWPFRVSRGSPARVAVADPESGRVTVYQVADGRALFSVQGPARGWFAPACATDLVAVCDEPDQIFLRSADGSRTLGALEAPFLLTWSKDDRILVTQGLPDQIVVWRTDSGDELSRFHLGAGSYLADVSASGDRIVTFGERDISLWSTATGTRLLKIESSRDVADARLLSEGRVAGLLRDGSAHTWTLPALL